LCELARENGVFFMEAMWTRFQPLTREVKKIAEDGLLGDIVTVHADLRFVNELVLYQQSYPVLTLKSRQWRFWYPKYWSFTIMKIIKVTKIDFVADIPKTHRILDPTLGGGALLDLGKRSSFGLWARKYLFKSLLTGPYPLIWALLFLYENPANKFEKPISIQGSMIKTPITGVDASTVFALSFGTGHLTGHAILSCNITIPSAQPGVYARFRNGNIKIDTPIYSPRSFTIQYFDKPGSGNVVREETKTFAYVGSGWHFQADEVARCARAGKIESDLWPHATSILEMEIFDQVGVNLMSDECAVVLKTPKVRKQGGYVFPDGVEHVVWKWCLWCS
jgi:hypothetical protein